MKFSGEDGYGPEIAAAIAAAGNRVSVPLVRAMIGAESGFNPRAYRAEPHIGDASRGLMQLLYKTAKGIGYTGSAEGLYDPATNIRLGVRFLSELVTAKGGDQWAAVSAYNNGNGKRATAQTRVCLARDSAGACVKYFTAEPGQFLNQPYVDRVGQLLEYFADQDESGSAAAGGSLATVALVGGGLYLLAKAARIL